MSATQPVNPAGNVSEERSDHLVATGNDFAQALARFPELAPSKDMDDAAVKQLEAKYKIALQIADQSLKDRELRLKENSARIDKWSNPLMVGVMVGALGLFGNFINGLWSNKNQQLQLHNQQVNEQIKLQNDLIKEAIKPADEVDRAKSLLFFARNGLIQLDEKTIQTLIKSAGTDLPIPGSSGNAPSAHFESQPLSFEQSIVDRIIAHTGVPYPDGSTHAAHPGDTSKVAIVLHEAVGPDAMLDMLRNGRPDLPGPLVHWAIQSDGKIAFIANETDRANHVGRADFGLTNSNTIGITVTGAAFTNETQTENLVRLVIDVAERWKIPTSKIYSHAEVALPKGRKIDMAQQAPIIRQMVDAVRQVRSGKASH